MPKPSSLQWQRWCPRRASNSQITNDPVQLGLVASLAQPGGNATGINNFSTELVAKRLAFLHELVPKAVRIAVLVNPGNATTDETTLRDVQEAARAIGLQIQVQSPESRLNGGFHRSQRLRGNTRSVTASRPRTTCEWWSLRPLGGGSRARTANTDGDPIPLQPAPR